MRISIAGIRGAAGTALTAELAMRLAAAFGTALHDDGGRPAVLLSRDTRPSGPMLAAAVRSALLAVGCDVVDLGVCPTPVMQWAVSHRGCAGGLAITAGHGPEHWNALKFVGPDGVFLDGQQGAELLDHFHHNRPRWAPTGELGTLTADSPEATQDALAAHQTAVLALIDRDAVAARGLRVAVDLANGACCAAAAALLEALGCHAIAVNDEPELPFPHAPEPTPQTMGQLRALVRAGGADLGLAFDADGDRLGIVTDQAVALTAAYTLALAGRAVLPREPGVVITNLSTSRLIDHVAERHGSRVERVRVGQSYIAEGVHIHQGVLGGEGSGGVMFPRLALAHDSLCTAAHLLDLLVRERCRASDLVADLPRYAWRELTVNLPAGEVVHRLTDLRAWAEDEVSDASVDLTEGLRLAWPDGWVHVRSSITEPAIRIVAEADHDEALEARLEEVVRRVRE
ncbi:MAG: hypothetical protein HYU66_05870 [Armatimonadetes bacterium]|nr:hypothetical protein [Armatimonadota bacterium]